jgi:outer membrane protein assembly factor BamB
MMLGFLPLAAASATDWPQFRYDAGRTAASPEELPTTLHLQWTRRFPAPQPAFPGEVRLRFDASYEPVVLGKTLFVPSMVTDSVTALDTETGDQRWTVFAEGPVRFAPVASQGKVYFVSDDGHLYCVDAANGQLIWKFQGLPPGARDRKILGNRRLISLWPAWGGPVLKDGVVYFGCGLWAAYGVCVHALDANSGQVLWTNADSNHVPKANMDHGIGNEAGLTPQGYLAVVHDKLVVPCGAQLPAFLDLKTGALGTYCMGWGGRNGLPKGTWFVAGTSHFLSHSGDLYDLARVNDETLGDPRWPTDFKTFLYPGQFTRLNIERTNQKDLGDFSQPVFAADVMYENDQGLVAHSLAESKLAERKSMEIPVYRRDDTYPDKWKGTFPEQWRLPSDRTVQIKAGPHLYVSGPGVVEAVRIPQPGEEPRVVWKSTLEGTPHRMLAADGKLFVVTREGAICAFGSQENANPATYAPTVADASSADPWTKTATDILQASQTREGYAVVLGFDTGRLIEELVRQSELYVIAIGKDAAKASDLRQTLHQAGFYGTRVSVHVGDPLSYPLPPYLASLVVSENWAEVGAVAERKVAEAVFHALRPYGGAACWTVPAAERDALVKQLTDSQLPGAAVRPVGDWVVLSREGPLPGSADWSHAEAEAGSTGASEDGFVQAPLELLWFDGPPRWYRTPGSVLVRVCGGRLLIKADKLKAIDVYTGRLLWETALPFGHNANDQFVALADAIYVTSGTACLVLDPVTGQKSGQIDLPAGLTGAWSNLRAWRDYLVGQSGTHLVCLNRKSGQLAWKFECGRSAISVAVGGGKVFCAELANQRRGETGAVTRALDIATGLPLWQIPGGTEVRYSSSLDLVVTSTGIYRAQDGTLVAALPEPPAPDPKKPNQPVPKPLLVAGSNLVFGTAENVLLFDLPSGLQTGGPLAWTRRGCTIPRASSHLITTRFRGNAACIDLGTRDILSLWNVRAACSNNLFPADGVLNVPSMTGGCTCNYTPVSQAFVPANAIDRN